MALGKRKQQEVTPYERGQQDYAAMRAPNPPGKPWHKQFKDYMEGYKNPVDEQVVPGAQNGDKYSNMSDGEMADEIRRLDKEKDEIQAKRKELADTLVARRGFGAHVYGNSAKATTVAPSISLSLDKDAVEREMGKDWLEKRQKVSNRSAQVRASDYNPHNEPAGK